MSQTKRVADSNVEFEKGKNENLTRLKEYAIKTDKKDIEEAIDKKRKTKEE